MSYAETIVTILKVDTDLKHLLPGGIHNFTAAGRKGLNRLQLGEAYNEKDGILKHVAIVAEMDEVADGQAVDPTQGYRTTMTQIWIRILGPGDGDYDTIDQVHNRILTLLDCVQIPGAFQAFWKKTFKDRREPNLREACYYQMVFDVQGYRQARS